VIYDPRVRREYTHARDLAEIILWSIDNQETNSLLNIGNTRLISVPELARSIALQLGLEKTQIKFIEQSGNAKLVQSTSNHKFLSLNNFNYRPLDDAVKDAVNWYLEHESSRGL